jgi:hypothetical protein
MVSKWKYDGGSHWAVIRAWVVVVGSFSLFFGMKLQVAERDVNHCPTVAGVTLAAGWTVASASVAVIFSPPKSCW